MSARDPARPRRVTGKSLLRQLMKVGDMRVRYLHPALCPMSAWPVMDAVADLVAQAAPEPAFYAPAELGAGGLAAAVAIQMNAGHREAEVTSSLEALQRAGLLLIDGAAMRLPLPERTDDEELERQARSKPGRPMAGETPEQYQARTAAEKERREAAKAQLRARDVARGGQGSMLLPIATPRSAVSDLPADFETDLRPDFPATSATTSATTLPSTSPDLSASRGSAAAADSLSIDRNQAAAAASAGTPRASDFSSDFSRGKSGDKSAGKSEPPPQPSPLATALAEGPAEALGLAPGQVIEAAAYSQAWLDRGATAEQLRGLWAETAGYHRRALEQGKAGVRGLGYMIEKVEARLFRAQQPAPAAAARQSSATAATPDAAPVAGCPAELVAQWDQVRARSRSRDADTHRMWVSKLVLVDLVDGQLVLEAPSRFHADWCRQRLGDDLLRLWRTTGAQIADVTFKVAAGQPQRMAG